MPDKKINQLATRFPLPSDYVVVGDPVTGLLYKCLVSDLSQAINASGNVAFISIVSQFSYTNAALVGASQVLVVIEGSVLAEGLAYNQYQFDSLTGTVTFGQTVEGQQVTIYYFN